MFKIRLVLSQARLTLCEIQPRCFQRNGIHLVVFYLRNRMKHSSEESLKSSKSHDNIPQNNRVNVLSVYSWLEPNLHSFICIHYSVNNMCRPEINKKGPRQTSRAFTSLKQLSFRVRVNIDRYNHVYSAGCPFVKTILSRFGDRVVPSLPHAAWRESSSNQ